MDSERTCCIVCNQPTGKPHSITCPFAYQKPAPPTRARERVVPTWRDVEVRISLAWHLREYRRLKRLPSVPREDYQYWGIVRDMAAEMARVHGMLAVVRLLRPSLHPELSRVAKRAFDGPKVRTIAPKGPESA